MWPVRAHGFFFPCRIVTSTQQLYLYTPDKCRGCLPHHVSQFGILEVFRETVPEHSGSDLVWVLQTVPSLCGPGCFRPLHRPGNAHPSAATSGMLQLRESLYPIYVVLGIEPTTPCVPNEHSIKQATSLVCH